MRVPIPNSFGTVLDVVSVFEHNDCNLLASGKFGRKGECGGAPGPRDNQPDLPFDPPIGRALPRSALDILAVQHWVVRVVDTEDYDNPSDVGASADDIYKTAILDFVIPDP